LHVFILILRPKWSRMPDKNSFFVSINSLIKTSYLGKSFDYVVMTPWRSDFYSLKPAFFDTFLLHWLWL